MSGREFLVAGPPRTGTAGTSRFRPSSRCWVCSKKHPIRLIKFSMVAVCLSTLVLGVVVSNAAPAPINVALGWVDDSAIL